MRGHAALCYCECFKPLLASWMIVVEVLKVIKSHLEVVAEALEKKVEIGCTITEDEELDKVKQVNGIWLDIQ